MARLEPAVGCPTWSTRAAIAGPSPAVGPTQLPLTWADGVASPGRVSSLQVDHIARGDPTAHCCQPARTSAAWT